MTNREIYFNLWGEWPDFDDEEEEREPNPEDEILQYKHELEIKRIANEEIAKEALSNIRFKEMLEQELDHYLFWKQSCDQKPYGPYGDPGLKEEWEYYSNALLGVATFMGWDSGAMNYYINYIFPKQFEKKR